MLESLPLPAMDCKGSLTWDEMISSLLEVFDRDGDKVSVEEVEDILAR